MLLKPIESITEADLRALIDSGAAESKSLEYKRELPDGGDAGKVKFLRSVTAFANTNGGDLIYGMDAVDGLPKQLVALAMPSADQVLQRLEQLCGAGVDPRLPGVQYRFIPLDSGGSVLVVRIARSWSGPHRVSAGGHGHFYGRNAAGAYQLDVGELRQAFTLSETVVERIRAFRADRLIALGSGQAPVPLENAGRVVLHLLPLQSFYGNVGIDITPDSDALRGISPPGSHGWSRRLNLDGRLAFEDGSNGRASAYAQLYRNGVVEAVMTFEARNGDRFIPSQWYEEQIIVALRSYLPALGALGMAPPAYACLALQGIDQYRFATGSFRFTREDRVADRDLMILPEAQIPDWKADPADVMRSTFDMIWNAFGFERSFNYDNEGRWTGQR